MNEVAVALREPLFRGASRLRVALVGMPGSGKSTLFKAVASTAIQQGRLSGSQCDYAECRVQVGFDELSLVDLPSFHTLLHLPQAELMSLKYLLWGEDRPVVSQHEPSGPPLPLAYPQVVVQVIDATALDRHLELSLELATLGRPMVIALNMMDESWRKGLHIDHKKLSRRLGVPVVPTVALMGRGLSELFRAVVDAARSQACPLPQPTSRHLDSTLLPLAQALLEPQLQAAFRAPPAFLQMQFAAGDRYFMDEMRQHFPLHYTTVESLRTEAERLLPRQLEEELHAERHHRAAILFESVTRLGAPHEGSGWRYWLDELFLHPRWGLVGSLAVFAFVLFIVFEVSVWLDSVTAARLVNALSGWQPISTGAVIARAVADGLVGLVGIVVPYMIPLVLLLVALEESGIMQRIAFVVDRWFHKIGLHGAVAVLFLLGLGCNVPAISSAANAAAGRDRIIASLLITFVPCSARSAIILALAGKYLGGLGVFSIFVLTTIVIAVLSKILTRRYPQCGPGLVQEIPAYSLPSVRAMLVNTWLRTKDILTIVTPLLVGGSVVLALLNHVGADRVINVLFTPVTSWWLGLPVALGVPILFGILRKELSLLMVYQALGSFEVGNYLDWVQIMTFLIFLTFYIPCVSTFAVMMKTLGRKEALYSVFLSISVALLISGVVRLILEVGRYSLA